ncbi:MAG TPA: AtpZ/AtpI family protein [Pyrinomonadaceae bacterium]
MADEEFKETPDQETNRKSGMAYAAGFTLFASVAAFTGLGWLADRWFQTDPWFLVLGIILGSIGGLYQFIRISSRTL